MKKNRIEVNIGNGMKIVAEQNSDSSYDREIYIGIENDNGVWLQDLAIVRQDYMYVDDDPMPVWKDDAFEVLVYGNPNSDDWTESFQIGLYKEE